MKQLAIIILIATILPGCAIADATLVEAETEQIETQSDADTIAALVAELRERDGLDRAVIDALLAELEAGRTDHRETVDTLLEMIAEQSKPQRSPWAVPLSVVVLLAAAAVWLRKRKLGRIVVMMLPASEQRAALSPGERWVVDVPMVVERDEVVTTQ